MIQGLKDLIELAATWPAEDQEELAEYAREIQARRTGVYPLSEEEWAGIQPGLQEAERGEFVSDAALAEADKRHGR